MEGMQVGECPWGVDAYLDGSFMVVLDSCYGAGDFFLWSVLMKLTSNEGRVVLLSANHGPEHWDHLFKKHSLELRRRGLVDRLNIRYIIPDGDSMVSEAEMRKAKDSIYPSEHWTCSQLMKWSEQGMQVPSFGDDNEPFAVFVDDMDALEAQFLQRGPSSGQCTQYLLHTWLHSLRVARQLRTLAVAGAGRSPSGSGNSHDNQAVSIIEVCQVLANITVRVNPLTSGYSRDVHGVVHVTALPLQPSKTALLGSATGENGMRLLEESYTFKTTPPGTIHSHMLVNDRI